MQVLTATGIAETKSGLYLPRGTAAHLSAGSTDPTEIDPNHQGRAPRAIPALLDLHFNSQQARSRCNMRFVGRTLQLHHAYGVGLLPLPNRHIQNTSSRTATVMGKGCPPNSKRKSMGQKGRTKELHLAHGVGLLPLSNRHIRNTSSRTATATGQGSPPNSKRKSKGPTKSGGKCVIINLYQFTAAKTAEQKEVWDIIAAWVLKHPNDNIILIGDFNSAPAGERTGYLLPLSDSLRQADARLLDFYQDKGGNLVSSRCHSWHRGKQSASLDNAVT